MAGDFNAKNSGWGAPITVWLGQQLAEVLASVGLEVVNRDGKPTFLRGTQESWIDITTCNVPSIIKDWRVMEGETPSNHCAIRYDIQREGEEEEWRRVTRWDLRRMAEGELLKGLSKLKVTAESTEERARELSSGIRLACASAIPSRHPRQRTSVYWWNK